MKQEFIIVAFDSTHDAIKAETVSGRVGITARLIPIPPEVSAGCGLALRADPEDLDRVRELLKEEEVTGQFYSLVREGIKRTVEKLED